MLRASAASILALLVLASCGDKMESRDKVQAAIMQRLKSSSGLDLNSLNVTTTSVTFDKNLAYAKLAFHPKTDTKVIDSMMMKYTLENRDGKWVVINVADSQGHGLTGHSRAGDDQLPPGHPPVDGSKTGTAQ